MGICGAEVLWGMALYVCVCVCVCVGGGGVEGGNGCCICGMCRVL